MRDGWSAPRTREHTFSTGRTATLRVALPTSQLVRDGLWDQSLDEAFNLAVRGELRDPVVAVPLFDAIVMGMFVDPRIVPDDQVDEAAGRVSLAVLEESEIEETLAAAFGGPAAAASFPGHAADGGGAGGGGSVADSTVKSAGPRGGKRRGSAAGSARGAAGAA